ncbi:MAG: PAS domain-containing protein [Alphaproteobacteria bacterium]|nr:PAS domain-containing protein [Alphaproteobacteria bacterium]
MNVMTAARDLNQRAAKESWHHFCDPTLAFKDPFYNNLLEPWRTKLGDRRMPTRTEISPRDIAKVLRNIVVLERVAKNPSSYIFRLIGTSLTDVAGHVTGKTFAETLPPNMLDRWLQCGDLVLDGGQPLRFLGRVHLQGREYLDAEHLYVPLANDNNEPTFIMGLCRYTPRQSESEEIWENELASLPQGLL